MKRLALLMAAIGILCGGGAGWAYEETAVEDGGTLSGTVRLDGKVPNPKGYNLVTFPDPVYCGRISDGKGFRLLQPFNVGPNGAFRNVVLFIEDIHRGKPIDMEPPRIEAIDCKFEPFITIVRDGYEVEVVNMDPVFHDIQAYETSERGARVLFNAPMPMNERFTKSGLATGRRDTHLAGTVMTQPVNMSPGRNVFVMQCGFHAYMESWGLAVDHPYFSKTDQQGRFAIPDIPPGKYEVTAWHPLIKKTFTVTIEPNQTVTLDVTMEAPKGRLYATESMDNPRFGKELLGDREIVPSVELQTY